VSGKMLSPEEVAKKLAVTPNTVRGWLREGSLSGIKLGKRIWRVNENDLQKYICCEQQVAYGAVEQAESVSKAQGRKVLEEIFNKESLLVKEESISVLREFEGIEDEY
jgi:excisionase family DNA binding protein